MCRFNPTKVTDLNGDFTMEYIDRKCDLYVGDCCKENYSSAGVGCVLNFPDGRKMGTCRVVDGNLTNQDIEWEALLFGLKNAINQGIKNIDIYCDSELIVKQINGEHKIENENIKSKYNLAQMALKLFENYTVNYISKDKNSEANGLAKKAIDLLDNPVEQELTPFHIPNIKNFITGSWTDFLDNNFTVKFDPNGLPRYFINSDVLYIGEISETDKILWQQFVKEADKAMSFLLDKEKNLSSPLHQKRYKLYQLCMFDLDNFRRFVFESNFLNALPVRPHIIENIKKSYYQLIHFGILYLKMVFLIQDTRNLFLAQ